MTTQTNHNQETKTMKAIKTTYLGPTDYRGSRIEASDGDRNQIVLDYAYELDSDENHISAAKALCAKMGWRGQMVMGGFPDCNVHVFVTRD
jgi:hypothetical protein